MSSSSPCPANHSRLQDTRIEESEPRTRTTQPLHILEVNDLSFALHAANKPIGRTCQSGLRLRGYERCHSYVLPIRAETSMNLNMTVHFTILSPPPARCPFGNCGHLIVLTSPSPRVDIRASSLEDNGHHLRTSFPFKHSIPSLVYTTRNCSPSSPTFPAPSAILPVLVHRLVTIQP